MLVTTSRRDSAYDQRKSHERIRHIALLAILGIEFLHQAGTATAAASFCLALGGKTIDAFESDMLRNPIEGFKTNLLSWITT